MVFYTYGWGNTPLRLAFGILALVSGIGAVIQAVKKDRIYLFVPVMLILGILLFMAARKAGGMLFEARYLLPLMPVYFVFLCMGLFDIGSFKWASKVKLPLTAAAMFLGLGFSLLGYGRS